MKRARGNPVWLLPRARHGDGARVFFGQILGVASRELCLRASFDRSSISEPKLSAEYWAGLGYRAAGANSPGLRRSGGEEVKTNLARKTMMNTRRFGSALELKNKEHFRAKKPREATPEQIVLAAFALKLRTCNLRFFLWRGRQVVRQGSAKPLTAVRFRPAPPIFVSAKFSSMTRCLAKFCGSGGRA